MLSREVVVRAFLTYVRPILEYASPVWSPYTRADIYKLESVQRRFTKRLPGFRNLDYQKRFAVLDVESLQLRRLRSYIIYSLRIKFCLA
jgi:ribonuclease P/MRP protein subunit RPP40